MEPAVADGTHEEGFRESVDRLGTDAVEADGELEDVVVVFAAGIHHRDAFDHLVERNAAAEVADGDAVIVDGEFDPFAMAHDELVDAVVDAFLEQHVDAVFGVRTIAQSANVHARSGAYVLRVFEVSDFAFVVNHFGFGLRLEVIFGHLYR